jgi:hypothetical protein
MATDYRKTTAKEEEFFFASVNPWPRLAVAGNPWPSVKSVARPYRCR